MTNTIIKVAGFLAIVIAVVMLVAWGPSVPGSPGVPEPVKVLENPATGERARFFREIMFKTPAGYQESRHLAEWTAAMEAKGFTWNINPVDDREQLARVRARNRALRPK